MEVCTRRSPSAGTSADARLLNTPWSACPVTVLIVAPSAPVRVRLASGWFSIEGRKQEARRKIKEEKSKKEDARYLKKIKSSYVAMASAYAAVHRWAVGEDPEDKR